MKKKIIKIIVALFLLLIIPILLIIVILYTNEKDLLKQFQKWIVEPGNLAAFAVSVGFYFPLINGIWKSILLMLQTIREKSFSRKNKSETMLKIYDDDKNNYIYFDKENDKIEISFKSSQHVKEKELLDMVFAETRSRLESFKKNNK